MQMKEIQKEILENKKRHGFNTTNIEQEFCYLYGELREAYEAYVKGWDIFGEELADVTNFLMGIAEIKGIDLATEILKKVAKNGDNALQQKEGIVLQLNPNITDASKPMKELQKEIRENDILQEEYLTTIEQKFCNVYGKVGEAYDAYYKGLGNFTEKLADVAIYLMELAEVNGIDLGTEIVRKVEKNKSRVYRQNELGNMVHL